VPCYALNEWILLDDGLGLIAKGAFMDTGGSVAIHLFGALFGLGAIMSLTTKKQFETKIEADHTSDLFSLLGSMVLWIFWPSFCSALVEPALVPMTIVNVIIALCASTLATFFASAAFRKKVSVADIANAALAGGVAIGSVCDKATTPTAFLIGLLAGLISTFGFAVIQGRFQSKIKKVDTCGVLYLHGLPGLLGGIAAIFVVGSIDYVAQIKGISITIVLALVAGLITGKVISLFKTVGDTYNDEEEME
jgi:ammonium transporter Rh